MSTTSQPGTDGRTVEVWMAYGLNCAIAAGPFSLNGYVQLPPGLRARGGLIEPVRVHGGLDWGPDDEGWIGFQTGHVGDFWALDDIGEYLKTPQGRAAAAAQQAQGTLRWTTQRLRGEVEKLAEQIAAQALSVRTG